MQVLPGSPRSTDRTSRRAAARVTSFGALATAGGVLLATAFGACHSAGRAGPEPGPVGVGTAADDAGAGPGVMPDGGAAVDATGAMDAAVATDAADAATDAPAEDVLPYLRGEARRAMITLTIERYNDVRACWLDAVLRQRGHRPETVTLHLSVAPNGRGTATVEDVEDPAFANCIRVRLGGHRYGPGDQVTIDATYRMSQN